MAQDISQKQRGNRQGRAPGQRRQRKQRVLTHKKPSQVASIADAIVIKEEDIFFLCARDGQVPLRGPHGLGLYYHDCRFLDGYELHLAEQKPGALIGTPRNGCLGVVQLTGPALDGLHRETVQKEDVGIHWERVLDSGRKLLIDRITLRNFSLCRWSF